MPDSTLSRSATSAMEAWKARGRELNEVYDAIARTVRAFGMEPTPDDPLADLARLEKSGRIMRHVAGMIDPVNLGNEYGLIHRTLIYDAQEAIR